MCIDNFGPLQIVKLLINTELLTALLPIFEGRAAMWVKQTETFFTSLLLLFIFPRDPEKSQIFSMQHQCLPVKAEQ